MERTVTTTEATAAATTAAAAATATAATITTQYEHKMSETMKQQRGGVNLVVIILRNDHRKETYLDLIHGQPIGNFISATYCFKYNGYG